MIGVEVRGADQVARRLLGAVRAAQAEEERALTLAANAVKRAIQLRMSDGGGRDSFFGRTGGKGNKLAARSGQSRRRIVAGRARRIGNVTTASAGSPDRHVAFHEEGGVIQGRPYLRIPLAAAQTPQGVDRHGPGRVPGTFIFRSRRGNAFIARRDDRALTLLYMLKDAVRIRGRHVFAGARKDSEPQVDAIIRGAITRVVRGANG